MVVGLPRSSLAPSAHFTSINDKWFAFFASLSSLSRSAKLSTDDTHLNPAPAARLFQSMLDDTVGRPPTVSCDSLLIRIYTMFSGLCLASTANAPRCIIAEPSPSIHHTFLSGLLRATPIAIDDVCPIEPTVRKSYP